MFDDKKGPIEHFSWGTFIINGEEHSKTEKGKKGKGKDVRLTGKKVKKWKEREGHLLEPHMITGVFDKDIKTLIIGAGVHHAIEVPDEVINTIKNHGIKEVKVLKTPEACKVYNELYHEGEKVAMLAHGTC